MFMGLALCLFQSNIFLNSFKVAGVVTKIGANVKDVKVGDHVGIGYFMDSCFECEYCEKDDEVNCLKGYTAKECQLKKTN